MTKNNSDKNSLYKKRHSFSDFILSSLIYVSAFITITVLASLIFYILINGLKFVSFDFVSTIYSENIPSLKGILPMIINTLYIVIITLLLSVPIGIASAIYLTQYAKQGKIVNIIRFTTEILSGIPSIIFGLFGYTIFCVLLGMGTSIIAGCLTMTLCVLPTIIRTTEETLMSVPDGYKEGAIALGIGKLRIILDIILPCSISGIITSIILAIGRIIGESAALLYTSGMAYNMPKNFFSHIMSSGRTLTLHLYQTAKQATSENAFQTAFATATVLLILVLILNVIANLISHFLQKSK